MVIGPGMHFSGALRNCQQKDVHVRSAPGSRTVYLRKGTTNVGSSAEEQNNWHLNPKKDAGDPIVHFGNYFCFGGRECCSRVKMPSDSHGSTVRFSACRA